MNREEAGENAKILLAFNAGATVQFRRTADFPHLNRNPWEDCLAPTVGFNFFKYDYRVKPKEPEEFYITVYGDEAKEAILYGRFDFGSGDKRNQGRVFKAVEVIKEE